MVRIGPLQLPDFPLLLAPMEDVSDPPFRAVCKDGGADLMYTEFISSEGLIRDAIKSRKKLDIFEEERPVGIQIFGGDEESLGLAAKIVEVTGPGHTPAARGPTYSGLRAIAATGGRLRPPAAVSAGRGLLRPHGRLRGVRCQPLPVARRQVPRQAELGDVPDLPQGAADLGVVGVR